MDIKEELNNYSKYKEKIINIDAEINELHENESGLPNGKLDVTGVRAKGYKKNVTEAMAISNIIKENKLNNRKEKLQRKMKLIEDIAEALKEEQRIVIKGFFIEGKPNFKIANELKALIGIEVSTEAVKKRKKRIIRNLQKKYNKN